MPSGQHHCARPVPGAATSAGPGPPAVEPPLLRGPGLHPFPRPLPPTPPRLRSGSPPPPRAAPPRPAGAAVSGAAGPSAAATAAAAAAAAIRDNQGRREGPDAGLPGPRIRIPGWCGVWSGRARGNPEPGWRSQILGLGMRGHTEPGLESLLWECWKTRRAG
ncbi:formin-like protein 20 [Pteropus medius]|uniref:formin-like protein 20 n=1 Tax=Pteropus vampyrus TaxID=132908 RepID=UPI00196A836B|nr:formin-like protein 20 [Pteropus giganteus]